MARPTPMAGCNLVLKGPAGMDCDSLPVFSGVCQGRRVLVSCWELTPEEVVEVARSGRVYLWVWGDQHPPVAITGEDPGIPYPGMEGGAEVSEKSGQDTEWQEAMEYLAEVEKAYAEIGSAGALALLHVIRPLRDRVNLGERTEDLRQAIMELE